ncbi:hypothetical protein Tco_0289621 [Tanacetum coccineum]
MIQHENKGITNGLARVKIYEFSIKSDPFILSALNDTIPISTGTSEQGADETDVPIRPRPCNYSFEEWIKIRIGHNNLHESDHEFIFNEWVLDSYDVEEEYTREIGDPYSRRFDEYNRVFNNEIEHLSNEHILRIGNKGGRSFICITDREDETLPLGRVNGARFKAMVRKELEGHKSLINTSFLDEYECSSLALE